MRKTQTVIAYAGGILLAAIAFAVIFLNDAIDYFWKLPQTLPNTVLFPVGAVILAAVYLFGRGIARRAEKKGASEKAIFCGVLVAALLFFLLQLYLSYQYYFRTQWDVDALFIGSMRLMSGGDLSALESYLAQYPNNILLVLLQSFVLKVNAVLHLFPEMDGLFSLVAFQCALESTTGVLLYHILRKITGRTEPAMGGFVLFLLFQLTSPWTVIPYTDTVGLIIPLLILTLVLAKSDRIWKSVLRWCVIGGSSYLAFQLKPQLAILTIAAVLVALTELIGTKPVQTAKKYAPVWGTFLLSFLLTALAVPRLERIFMPITFYDNANMIPTHYIMMGLNTERDGAYVYEDVLMSQNEPNREARKAKNLRVIRKRLSEMGAGGLCTHLGKKLISCYADGTFFWSREGKIFYYAIPEEKNDTLSPLLRNIFLDTEEYGAHYDGWVLLRQAIWCAALVLAAVGALAARREGYDIAAVAIVFLSIIGLTAFELLFEARSRYLYSYVPVYLMAAVFGLDVLTEKLRAAKRAKGKAQK